MTASPTPHPKTTAMKSIATGTIAVAVCAVCFSLGVTDGGNVDFYWKPLMAIWYAVTLGAFLMQKSWPTLGKIKGMWWLQLAVPVVLFFLSVALVSVYEPHPWPITPRP